MKTDAKKLKQAVVAQMRAILQAKLTPKELKQITVEDDGAIVGAPQVVKKAIKLIAQPDQP